MLIILVAYDQQHPSEKEKKEKEKKYNGSIKMPQEGNILFWKSKYPLTNYKEILTKLPGLDCFNMPHSIKLYNPKLICRAKGPLAQ